MTGSDGGRFARGVALLRSDGIGGLVRWAGDYAQRHKWVVWLTEFYVMYLLFMPEAAGLAGPADVVFSMADPSDLAAMVACTRGEEHPARLSALFTGFFAAGHNCAVARDQHGIVGYLWAFRGEYVLTFDAYGPHSMLVILEPNAVFTGNAFVRSDSRRRGIFRNLKHYLMRQYSPGTHFYTSINRENSASLTANRRLGFVPLATLRLLGLGSQAALWWRPADSAHWLRAGLRWPTMTMRPSAAHMTIGAPSAR